MRAVLQRVLWASVSTPDTSAATEVARIGPGMLILVGVRTDDTEAHARALADKVANLRIFEDEAGKLNRSLIDTGRSALVVSNFTLYADCRKGRRPAFTDAAAGEQAERLYRAFGNGIARHGVQVEFGVFGAHMQLALVNDGPVTLVIDTSELSVGTAPLSLDSGPQI